MAPEPALVLAVARAAPADEAPEALGVVEHLEVRHLVLDDVVHDLLRREQQAPVEAHRAVRRAACPARSLGANGQPLVGGPGAGAGGVEAPPDLRACALAIPAFEGIAKRLAPGLADLHLEDAPGPLRHVWPHTPWLDEHPEDELMPHVRDRPAILEPDPGVLLGRADPPQRPLDPRALLLHERLDVLQRHPPGADHLDAVGVHDDARLAGAIGAADGVGDAVLGLGHGPRTIGT